MSRPLLIALRVALVIGGFVDALVGVLALFFQPLLGPLLDVPSHDPTLAAIAGAETLVVSCIYATILRDPRRFQPLLYLVALDQIFAIVIPAVLIGHGQLTASLKTLGPMPGNALLLAIFLFAATRKKLDEQRRRGPYQLR